MRMIRSDKIIYTTENRPILPLKKENSISKDFFGKKNSQSESEIFQKNSNLNLNLNFEVPPLILDNPRDVSTVRSDVSTVRSDVSTVQSRRANSTVDIQNIFQDENNEINFKNGNRIDINNSKYVHVPPRAVS